MSAAERWPRLRRWPWLGTALVLAGLGFALASGGAGWWVFTILGALLVALRGVTALRASAIAASRLRLSAEGAVTVLIALGFFAAAFNTGSNLLYLVLAAVLAFLALSLGLVDLGLRGLLIRRDAPETAVLGEEVLIEIWARNPRRLPLFGLEVLEDGAEHTDPRMRAGVFFDAIPPGATVRAGFRTRFLRRGPARLPRLAIRMGFPVGLIEKTTLIAWPAEVLVLPRMRPLLAEARDDSALEAAEGQRSAILGAERRDRLRHIRDYQPGDRLRAIHWPTSARYGRLMVREFERPIPRDNVIAVLGAAVEDPGHRDEAAESDWEAAIDLAAALLGELVGDRDEEACVLAWTGEAGEARRARPGLIEPLKLLARARPGGQARDFTASRLGARGEGRRVFIIADMAVGDPRVQALRRTLGGGRCLSTAGGRRYTSAQEDA